MSKKDQVVHIFSAIAEVITIICTHENLVT